ncbi:hypothetical protein BJ138DRAFT_833937 [Hygrophoropsis aurantiaca]|uniref:Uncharacterized protein n=1 Tax=Hygrophoropsis aurantiaca TaxID=72124 RepID=A0ACB7ZVS3_9AGAM|nr:hypothetical protein BJ138DRAFT_833937 [Hygrophoropsis aurantiaca]
MCPANRVEFPTQRSAPAELGSIDLSDGVGLGFSLGRNRPSKRESEQYAHLSTSRANFSFSPRWGHTQPTTINATTSPKLSISTPRKHTRTTPTSYTHPHPTSTPKAGKRSRTPTLRSPTRHRLGIGLNTSSYSSLDSQNHGRGRGHAPSRTQTQTQPRAQTQTQTQLPHHLYLSLPRPLGSRTNSHGDSRSVKTWARTAHLHEVKAGGRRDSVRSADSVRSDGRRNGSRSRSRSTTRRDGREGTADANEDVFEGSENRHPHPNYSLRRGEKTTETVGGDGVLGEFVSRGPLSPVDLPRRGGGYGDMTHRREAADGGKMDWGGDEGDMDGDGGNGDAWVDTDVEESEIDSNVAEVEP